jgi:hypothetical protein
LSLLKALVHPLELLKSPLGLLKVGRHTGEGIFNLFGLYSGQSAERFDRSGKLNRRPCTPPAPIGSKRSGTASLLFPGSGREGCADGLSHETALTQPSGITTDGSSLIVADSETSAVRVAVLVFQDQVTTLTLGRAAG